MRSVTPLFCGLLCLLTLPGARAADAPAKSLPAATAGAPHCPRVGDAAPPFGITMDDGSDGVSLREALSHKRPVVIDFFSWHCVPCRKELPALQQLSAELAGKATFVLVHLDGSEAQMKRMLGDLHVTLPAASASMADAESRPEVQKRYCVNNIPLLLILDAKGIVRASIEGGRNDFKQAVRSAVALAGR